MAQSQFTRTPRAEPMSPEKFGERLRDIYSIREAEPVLNEYLASIQIDDDDPGFLFDWQIDNLNEFVRAANRLELERRARDAAQRQGDQDLAAQDQAGQGHAGHDQANRMGAVQAPVLGAPWLRTRPPQMTSSSLADDLVSYLQQHAGGRCGQVLLAPNNQVQFAAILVRMAGMQNDTLLQEAMRAAFPAADGVERYLVVTYYLWTQKCTEWCQTISNRLCQRKPGPSALPLDWLDSQVGGGGKKVEGHPPFAFQEANAS